MHKTDSVIMQACSFSAALGLLSQTRKAICFLLEDGNKILDNDTFGCHEWKLLCDALAGLKTDYGRDRFNPSILEVYGCKMFDRALEVLVAQVESGKEIDEEFCRTVIAHLAPRVPLVQDRETVAQITDDLANRVVVPWYGRRKKIKPEHWEFLPPLAAARFPDDARAYTFWQNKLRDDINSLRQQGRRK